jgi:hypothetical protein
MVPTENFGEAAPTAITSQPPSFNLIINMKLSTIYFTFLYASYSGVLAATTSATGFAGQDAVNVGPGFDSVAGSESSQGQNPSGKIVQNSFIS